MTPRIELSKEKKLVGKRLTMSFTNYIVTELWRTFSPRRKEITNNITNELISLVIYPPNHFEDFKQTNEFEKWAAVEVKSFDNIPADMESLVLEGGLYAVFDYKGFDSDNTIFKYIFETWLPTSEYNLDNRPHFEILGDKYKNNDQASEEEIWIPVKAKPILQTIKHN